jgi:hypothetical protein
LLVACGGGGSTSKVPSGSVSLHVAWEQSAIVPDAVQTVEVRIVTARTTTREFFDPDTIQSGDSASIAGIPAGKAVVTIFGYDVPLLGATDPTQVDFAPSYASAGVEILVPARKSKDAGEIQAFAQPFVTEFDPPPAALVEPTRRVQFLLAIALGEIDPASVDIEIDGLAQVVAGVPQGEAELVACADGTELPCGGADRGLTGFRFRAAPAALPELSNVTVAVRASGGEPSRELDFEYTFDTEGGTAAIERDRRVADAPSEQG